MTLPQTRPTLNAQFDSPGRPVWTVKQPSGVDSGAVNAEAIMRDVLLAFGSSLAVMWVFGTYEIIRNMRNRVAFGFGGVLARWTTPVCITCTVAAFAGVILLRS